MKKTLLFAVFLICAVGLYYIWVKPDDKINVNIGLPTNVPSEITITPVVPNDWETYSSDQLNFTISHPKDYSVEKNGENSITLTKTDNVQSVGPANFIYVSVVTDDKYENDGEIYNFNNDDYEKLLKLEVGESVSFAANDMPALDEWFTYTRVDDTVIDGHQTRRFENNKPWEFPKGTTEVRYIFDDNGAIYVLGYYYGGEGLKDPIDPREAFTIVSTFNLK